MKSFDIVMDIHPTGSRPAAKALAEAPTQPLPKKGSSDTTPKTLPPTPQPACVR